MSNATHKFKIGNIISGRCDAPRASQCRGDPPEAFMAHLLTAIAQKALSEHICHLTYTHRSIHNIRCKSDTQNADDVSLCFHMYSLPVTDERFVARILLYTTQLFPGAYCDSDVSFRILDNHSMLVKISKAKSYWIQAICSMLLVVLLTFCLHFRMWA